MPNASIAQLAEHLTVNQRVTGSSPVGSAKKADNRAVYQLFYWRALTVFIGYFGVSTQIPPFDCKLKTGFKVHMQG